MPNVVGPALSHDTTRWSRRAEEALECPPEDARAWLDLVRDGMRLRRRWDASAAPSEQRRGLLSLLVYLQTACQQALAEWAAPPPTDDASAELRERRSALIDTVLDQLAEGDAYLAALLGDTTADPELLARAVEAFRDDLHWLATLVALLDGSAPPDLVGRLLAEQEAIERALNADPAPADTRAGAGQGGDASGADDALHDARCLAHQLRSDALEQRIEALLSAPPPPDDYREWFERWCAAGRLMMHGDVLYSNGAAEGTGTSNVPDAAASQSKRRLYDRLRASRDVSATEWRRCITRLEPHERDEALERAAVEIMDAASDALTFLEDLPLADEVRTLHVVADDLAVCRAGVAQIASQAEPSPRTARLQRKLKRRSSAVTAELQERELAWRMERRFGRRAVAALESFIFALLLIFVVLLVIEGPLIRWEVAQGWEPAAAGADPAPGPIEATLAWIDLAICLVFLGEFGLKFAMVTGRWRYVARHWLTGLLPAIPFGFLAYATHHAVLAGYAEDFVLLRGLRYLRLPRMLRWLRVARPVVRAGRLVAFVLRTADRLVRQLAPVLNRNLLLFERADLEVHEPEYRIALAGLRERFIYRAGEARAHLGAPARWRVARDRMHDLACILEAAPVGVVTLGATVDVAASREIPLESVIARLLTATPAQVAERIGARSAEQLTHWCRAFDVPLVRRLPLLRQLVAAGRLRDPTEAAARVAHQLGVHLKRALDGVYWCADLYGTLTAPQMVDALGDWLVKGTARPTRRLLLLGGSFLLVSYLASLMPIGALRQLSEFLGKFVAGSLLVVGLLCLVPLSLGIWFRRIAGQATEFYDQVAEAQYLSATGRLKERLAAPQASVLHRRVVTPELRLLGIACAPDTSRCAAGAAEAAVRSSDCAQAEQQRRVCQAVDRIWNDYLEGAPFHRSDTKTTTQLLGNLVLVSLRESRLGYSRADRKRLRRLDLDRQRGAFTGPYLWFHFISRSLAQHTAKLIVDYNAHAIPLSRAAVASATELAEYRHWLSERLGMPPQTVALPEAFRGSSAVPQTDCPADPRPPHAMYFHGNDFTAQHFLSADDDVQRDVCRRYGEQLAALVRRDRRDNVRRVFRSFPFHHWPKEKRTVNPLMLYQRHLDGGRVLLIPFKVLAWASVGCWRAARMVTRVVTDVLNPVEVMLSGLRESDPFAVAVRKIHRMRKPVFLECLRMRARFDPEYLGASLPGVPHVEDGASTAGPTSAASIEQDLDRIDAGLRIRDEFRELAAQRRRQLHDFARWLDRFGWNAASLSPDPAAFAATANPAPASSAPRAALRVPRFSPESLRAMAVAYCVDHCGLRTRLEATETLQRAFDEAVLPHDVLAPKPASQHRRTISRIATLFTGRSLTASKRLRRLFEQPAFARYTQQQRRWCCAMLRAHHGPHRQALGRLTRRRAPADPVGDARRKLLAVARDPSPWSQQMLVLRTVQTLTVLDLQTYCDLARELGEYESP